MSPLTTRSRVLPFYIGNGVTKTYFVDNTGKVLAQAPTRETAVFKGKQVTASEGHPFRSRSRANRDDIGGEFSTTRSYIEAFKPQRVFVRADKGGFPTRAFSTRVDFSGPLFPLDPTLSGRTPPDGRSTDSTIDAAGATAVARCKPTNSIADAATFLGELYQDGLPHLIGHTTWKDRTLKARNAGKEYLNYQFGWRPLVSDVRSFATAVTHAHSVLSQFERDSGKQVRRTYNFPVQRSTSTSVFSNAAGCVMFPYNSDTVNEVGFGSVIKTVETVQRRWFSGAFTYYLPSGNDYRSKMIRYALEADKLFGISLTPDTLWNLAPWSWAADWFSNTGDVVSNLSDWATYGLVMRYGYMMEHTVVRHTYSFTTASGQPAPKYSVSPITYVTETKVRRRANPFGFGLTWNGLSSFQLSIAAALGLSRR